MNRDKHLSKKQRLLWDYLLSKTNRGVILKNDMKYLWKDSGHSKITFGILVKFLTDNRVIKTYRSGNFKIESKNNTKYKKKKVIMSLKEYYSFGGGVSRLSLDKIRYIGKNLVFKSSNMISIKLNSENSFEVEFSEYSITYLISGDDLEADVKLGLSSEYLI